MGYCGWADFNERNKTYHDNEWVAAHPGDVRLATTGVERRPTGA
ncbi:hypothetical protein SAMN02910263_04078 [Butyrivibrio sp. INlla16]|nr:hypothetical protein SAMN02910263_04078 [Butyrivibrio sp. INlla16]